MFQWYEREWDENMPTLTAEIMWAKGNGSGKNRKKYTRSDGQRERERVKKQRRKKTNDSQVVAFMLATIPQTHKTHSQRFKVEPIASMRECFIWRWNYYLVFMYLYTFFVYNFFLLSSMHVFSLQNPHLYIFRFSSSENSRNCQRCNNNKCDCSLYLRFSSPFATHTHTHRPICCTQWICVHIFVRV